MPDSPASPATTPVPWHFGVLARFRALQMRNAIDRQLKEAPGRAFMVAVLLVLIWAALYQILSAVLQQVGRFELVALVAKQQIFVHFFFVLAAMLAFSNAILSFSSLFGRQEAAHLLAMPVTPQQVVCLKWLEGLVLSSWSFLLLGVPLMLAMGSNTDVEWYYYPLFVGHFLGFVVVPATLGLLGAWAVALWAPRRPLAVMMWCGALVIGAGALWAWNVLRTAEPSEEWLRTFYRQLSLARQPLLPSTWSAKGVFAAIERQADVSLLYLGVVLANAAFLSWLTVNLVGRTWSRAYSRASHTQIRSRIRRGWLTSAACWVLFPYLPSRLRTLMLKDVRSFARDATQWTQMVIMLGLLIIYALNLKRLPFDSSGTGMRAVVAFLNLTTISLIMATFTSRFVYPLLSLESQQLWTLGLLPEPRSSVLLVKFIFSVTVTGLSSLVVMGLAVRALELPREWAQLQMAICLAVCVGLSGLAVGLGARFPVLGQRNSARIASGFGGTLNLVASMLFVAVEMAGFGYLGMVRFGERIRVLEDLGISTLLTPVLLSFGLIVAFASLAVGARHFERLEY